ncbi:LptF/LptG family permease [Rhodohalobacter sp.]|uniref:LptF/LptG family permease n=1 Tax=Rhodohalobacter sp. TaxID=1974210 RepID=UPI002ACD9E29|nr:LptF/LptG family permease [Rhodohalobacter sp.]MDZ7756063.1 LptF/LptG family permease [Rhodohalobacter sp.]
MLIFIFIMVDFSENSDDFADQGATMAEIFNRYYLNYIPEMTRLVLPVAVFVACLFLTGTTCRPTRDYRSQSSRSKPIPFDRSLYRLCPGLCHLHQPAGCFCDSNIQCRAHRF